MARPTFDMQELKATGFKTNDRRYLDKAHELAIGYKPEAHETDDQIREKLYEVYPDSRNTAFHVEPVSNVVSIDEKTVPVLRKIPNLGGIGIWEGKKRRVMYSRKTDSKFENALPVRWEEMLVILPHGVQMDVPYPIYHNLLSAIDIQLIRNKVVPDETPGAADGARVVAEQEIITQKYNITDLGDTPGTEHLHENYGEYFRHVARETNMLHSVSRALILRVHTILFGTTPITELVHVSDQDIRLKIATRLGPEFEQIMADELYGSAVA